MTLLSIVQSMCDTLALDRPLTVVGNADSLTREMLGALNDAGKAMARENDPAWACLTRFANFTATAVELQGDLSTIAPDYGFMVSDTLWDTTSVWPTSGSITPQQWSFLKIRGGIAPYGKFRIYVNPTTNKLGLYSIPQAQGGNTCTFEYVSKMWVISPNINPNGLMTWDNFQTDNDTVFYDEECLKQQAVWRFKKTKGMEDWPSWKADADAFMATVKTQEIGSSTFYIGTFRGTRLISLSNVQDGNYPASST